MPGVQLRGPVLVEPFRDAVDVSDVGPRVVVEGRVALQFRKPPGHLPFQKSVRLSETAEAHGDMVDGAESGQRVGHREPHLELHACRMRAAPAVLRPR